MDTIVGKTTDGKNIKRIKIRDDGWCTYRAYLTGINLNYIETQYIRKIEVTDAEMRIHSISVFLTLTDDITYDAIKLFTISNAEKSISEIGNPLYLDALTKIRRNFTGALKTQYENNCKDLWNGTKKVVEKVQLICGLLNIDQYIYEGNVIIKSDRDDTFISTYLDRLAGSETDELPLVYPDPQLFAIYTKNISCYISDFDIDNIKTYDCNKCKFCLLQIGRNHIDLGVFIKDPGQAPAPASGAGQAPVPDLTKYPKGLPEDWKEIWDHLNSQDNGEQRLNIIIKALNEGKLEKIPKQIRDIYLEKDEDYFNMFSGGSIKNNLYKYHKYSQKLKNI